MALTDRVDRLQGAIAALTERGDILLKAVERLNTADVDTAEALAAVRQEVALLKQGAEKDLAALKAEAQKELAALRHELRQEMAQNREAALADRDVVLAALRQELALFKQLAAKEIDDLKAHNADQKKAGEEWGRRAWSFGPNVIAAILTVILSAVVAWLTVRR